MARRPLLWLTVLVAGAGAIGLAYKLRPTWRTASKAEVESWLDPKFFASDPPDPAAEARSVRLRDTMAKLGFSVSTEPSLAALMQIFARPDSSSREALWTLSGEGPVQYSPRSTSAAYPGNLSLLSESLAYAGEGRAKKGDPLTAAKLMGTAVWVMDQIGEYPSRGFSSAAADQALRGFGGYFESTLPLLRESDLALLASRIPPTSRHNRSLRNGIAATVRNDLLPVLPDPLAWAIAKDANAPPMRTIEPLLLYEAADLSQETYDAERMVKEVNRAFLPLMENAMRSPGGYDPGPVALAKGLKSKMPISTAGGKQGWEKKWAKFRYRWEMALTPNSLGDRILIAWIPVIDGVQQDSYQTIALRESIRARVALQRYRLEFGRSAPSLDALVQTKLLTSLPLDGLSDGPLRYDPRRKRLWSVGRNRKDDGGKARKFGQFFEPDYVWETP